MMGVFLGATLGSALVMFVLCIAVYKVGPKKLPLSLFLQALVSGLITWYLSSDHYGIHYRQVDVAANWAGWVLALIVMIVVLLKRRSNRTTP